MRCHLGVNCRLEATGAEEPPGPWVVWRVDDPGNRYEMRRFSREASARCFADYLEARAHKQSYGVERRGPARPLEARFGLWRQDEGGTRYLMRTDPQREGLDVLAELYGAEPRHKQAYFVEALG